MMNHLILLLLFTSALSGATCSKPTAEVLSKVMMRLSERVSSFEGASITGVFVENDCTKRLTLSSKRALGLSELMIFLSADDREVRLRRNGEVFVETDVDGFITQFVSVQNELNRRIEGKPVMHVFYDPSCPYSLEHVKNVLTFVRSSKTQVFLRLYAIGPGAERYRTGERLACAEILGFRDYVSSLETIALGDGMPSNLTQASNRFLNECLDQHQRLGRKLQVENWAEILGLRSTPVTIIGTEIVRGRLEKSEISDLLKKHL